MERTATRNEVIWRALRLRCPVCGVGRQFRGLTMRKQCPHCGFFFEREVGYFTNALIVNYTITCLPILFLIAPLAYLEVFSVRVLLTAGLLIAIALPILTFPHSKALWLAFDVLIRPPTAVEFDPHPHELE